MSKILPLLLSCVLFLSCVSTENLNSEEKNVFNTEYDKVLNNTYMTHKDLVYNSLKMPNVEAGLVETVNVSMYILNEKSLIINIRYSNKDWLFINSLVFLGDDNTRIKLSGKRINEDVIAVSHNVSIKERFISQLSNENINLLYNLLNESNTISVSLIGKNYRTKELKIKPSVKKAILQTIDKYKEINNL